MPFPYREEWDPASEDLTLIGVTLVHRHGERTPIRPLRKDSSPPWNLCHFLPQIHALYKLADGASVQRDTDTDTAESLSFTPLLEQPAPAPASAPPAALLSFARIISCRDSSSASYSCAPEITAQLASFKSDGECSYGQLTDIGKTSMLHMGSNLRDFLVKKRGLLSSKLNPSEIYVRTTDYARTIESVQYLLNGLYPANYRPAGSSHLDIHIKSPENLYPKASCKRMVQLSSAFRKRAQEENQGEIAAIAARLQSLGFSTVTPDIKSIHGHYDHLVCAQASGVHTPKDLASEDMLRMEKLCVNLWWKTYSETPEMSRLSMGMFVKDLKQSIHTCATTPNAPKLSIFSGHDSSVGPLLSVFGVFNNRFPPFGSVVSFEQFEEMATKTGIPPVSPHQRHYNISKSFIRMSYNGDPVIIPHCALPGNHRQDDKTLCRLEAFFDHADSMIPKNYEKECESV